MGNNQICLTIEQIYEPSPTKEPHSMAFILSENVTDRRNGKHS